MKDYTELLPLHEERYVGEHDLFLEIFNISQSLEAPKNKPPLLFVHGAYTGSWMWSKYIPLFVKEGWRCYAMNLRSHYKSRVMDMSKITFEDYLGDIEEIIAVVTAECNVAPIILGFSLGGILCQKLAENVKLAGLVLIDSCISKEVNDCLPYDQLSENDLEIIIPAPDRKESSSIDESEEDIAFQKKYLSMEASKVFLACGCWIKGIPGISINYQQITCPSLVIKSVNSKDDDTRGGIEAKYLNAKYRGFWNTTHTGLLVGQRYQEMADSILEWFHSFK